MNREIQRLSALRRLWSALGWACIFLGTGCLIGVVVTFVMIGLGSRDLVLLGALCGGFTGGVLLFALCGIFGIKKSGRVGFRELDALEREDSEESFFVGEGTLLTFGEDRAILHRASEKKKISVPYAEMKFYAVCNRRAPRDRGEDSVIVEIPAHYLSKKGGRENDPPALVQTDGKQRLYDCLVRHGLELIGKSGKGSGKKFTLIKKFSLPDEKKRRRTVIYLCLSVFCLAAGIGLAFWQTAIGAVLSAVGLYFITRAAISCFRSSRVLGIYEEGLFWKEDPVFLKWEEIVHISRYGTGELQVDCPYGAYRFPLPEGAYEAIETRHFALCGSGEKKK